MGWSARTAPFFCGTDVWECVRQTSTRHLPLALRAPISTVQRPRAPAPEPLEALPYTGGMSQLVELMRRTLREQIARMSAEDRVRLTARLAQSDLDIYCATREVNAVAASRALRRRRQVGRRPSRVAEAIDQ